MRWVLLRRRELGCRRDQLAWAGELLGARGTAVSEQAVVPDAVEALGQHVHEEAANELARLERHGCLKLTVCHQSKPDRGVITFSRAPWAGKSRKTLPKQPHNCFHASRGQAWHH
jgi:hypothetical protein